MTDKDKGGASPTAAAATKSTAKKTHKATRPETGAAVSNGTPAGQMPPAAPASAAPPAPPATPPASPAGPGMAETQAAIPMTDTPPPPPTYTSAPVLAPTGVARPPVSGMPKPPPKPLGNDGRDFKAGDHVVYPTHGVGQVQGIEEIIVMGAVIGMIVVTFDENRMTLKVPISKASTAGLRMLADGPKIGEALDTLKGRARIKRTMWSRRAQEYEQKINSGDPISIAEVVRDLHRNSGQPDQSFSERQIYEQALDRLAAEVAAIDKTDKPTAVEKLLATLKLGLAS